MVSRVTLKARSRLEALFSMRRLRIAARLAVGFSVVSGLLLALVACVAIFGHIQREALAAGIGATTAKEAVISSIKNITQDRAEYLRGIGATVDLRGALREGGELQRLAGEYAQALA